MKTFRFITLGFLIIMTSCMSVEEKKKKAEEEGNTIVSIKSKLIKGAGEALKSDGKEAAQSASEGVGEVIKGISTGYDKSLKQVKLIPDKSFKETFEFGRSAYNDSTNVKRLTVYLIANKSYEGGIRLKAFDIDKKEIGRSTLQINMAEDDAKYFDFEFDKRTPLTLASFFTLEKK